MIRRKKPGPTAKRRAQKKRKDDAYAQKIRAIVAERDGFCRLVSLNDCSGVSEWAHLEGSRRFETRGLPPEERHTTAWSLMLCTRHHELYDAHGFTFGGITALGANCELELIGWRARIWV